MSSPVIVPVAVRCMRAVKKVESSEGHVLEVSRHLQKMVSAAMRALMLSPAALTIPSYPTVRNTRSIVMAESRADELSARHAVVTRRPCCPNASLLRDERSRLPPRSRPPRCRRTRSTA